MQDRLLYNSASKEGICMFAWFNSLLMLFGYHSADSTQPDTVGSQGGGDNH